MSTELTPEESEHIERHAAKFRDAALVHVQHMSGRKDISKDALAVIDAMCFVLSCALYGVGKEISGRLP